MADAPKMIGLVQNLLGQWALATRDERGHAIHYTRADLIDMDVLMRVEAALEDYSHYLEASEETNTLLSDLRAMMEKLK